MDIKSLTITGNLVEDAEIKTGENGTFIAMKVACNTNKEEVEFYSVTHGVEVLLPYLIKGKKVGVTGIPFSKPSKPNSHGVVEVYQSIKQAKVFLL